MSGLPSGAVEPLSIDTEVAVQASTVVETVTFLHRANDVSSLTISPIPWVVPRVAL